MEFFVVAKLNSSDLEGAISRCRSIALEIESIGKVQDFVKESSKNCCGGNCGCQ